MADDAEAWGDFFREHPMMSWVMAIGGLSLMLLALLATEKRKNAFVRYAVQRWEAWRYDRRRSKGIPLDASARLNFFDVACICAGFQPSEHIKDDDEVQLWMRRLKGRWTWDIRPIEEDTELPTSEWLRIVHGICRQLDKPLPSYFEKYFHDGDWVEFESSQPKPPMLRLSPKWRQGD